MNMIRSMGKTGIIVISPKITNFPTDIPDEILDLYDRGLEKVLVDMTSVAQISKNSVKDLLAFINENPTKPFCFVGARRFIKDEMISLGLRSAFFFDNERHAAHSSIFPIKVVSGET